MGKISPERVASNELLAKWCKPVTGVVLSIGSGGDIDKQGRHYRDYFASAEQYITSDVVPGCDLTMDARRMLPIQDGSIGGVFCSGVLEHVDDYAAVIGEVMRVLEPGGVFIVGVPFKQPVHRSPGDFWRFTEFGLRHALRFFDVLDLRPVGDPAFPFGYWAFARKM